MNGTRNTSRRAFLTGAAPVAAALVLAGGTAAVDAAVAPATTPGAAPADPIFALIEQHRAALREEERTSDIFEKHAAVEPLENDDNRGVVVGERPNTELDRVFETDADGISNMRWFQTTKMRPIVVFIPKMIANYAPKDLGEAERAEWIKDKTNELRRNKRAYERRKRRNENSARSLAWSAWNKAGEVTDGLSKQLIETSPTTVAGVAAVLAHWSEVMDEDEHDRDFISTTEFLQSLAKGVKALG
jgi:hypothetical protein